MATASANYRMIDWEVTDRQLNILDLDCHHTYTCVADVIVNCAVCQQFNKRTLSLLLLAKLLYGHYASQPVSDGMILLKQSLSENN